MEDREPYIAEGGAMNENDHDPVVALVRRRIESERRMLVDMRAGVFAMTEMRDGRRIDVTDEVIATSEAALEDLTAVLRRLEDRPDG